MGSDSPLSKGSAIRVSDAPLPLAGCVKVTEDSQDEIVRTYRVQLLDGLRWHEIYGPGNCFRLFTKLKRQNIGCSVPKRKSLMFGPKDQPLHSFLQASIELA